MAIVNTISLSKKVETTLQGQKFVAFARNAANTRFVAAKQDMIKNIQDSEVSKEIEEACANPSINESDMVSKGNIAAVMGFYKGSNPVELLELYMWNNTTMENKPNISLSKNKVNYSFPINIPSKEILYKDFPVPGRWSSRSWLDMVENGISFLSRYIFWAAGFGEKSGSRSGTGLQSKGNVKNVAKFSPKPYITEIINKFKEYFKK